VHVRTWGLLRDREQWASYTLDFGPGGETAALASHARIVRVKTSAKYAARRGAYVVLEDDEVWSVPTGNRSAAEEEAEALVQQHMLFVLGSGSTLATDEPAAGEDEDAEDEEMAGTERGERLSFSRLPVTAARYGEVGWRAAPSDGDDGEGGRMLTWGRKTLVMGILNVTPDSFSDGGRLLGSRRSELADSDDNSDGQGGSSSASMVGDAQTGVGSSVGSLQRAVDCARRMVLDGADLLDIGGQSTRPGSTRVSASEEASRVIPVIK
jgi:hypothetical protein